jgi:hypothetical protein
MDPTKAPPAKSPAERMRQTTGAAGRDGAEIPPPGLGPSASSSSPSDSGPRFAAISSPYSPSVSLSRSVLSVPGFIPELELISWAGSSGLTRPTKELFRSHQSVRSQEEPDQIKNEETAKTSKSTRDQDTARNFIINLNGDTVVLQLKLDKNPKLDNSIWHKNTFFHSLLLNLYIGWGLDLGRLLRCDHWAEPACIIPDIPRP